MYGRTGRLTAQNGDFRPGQFPDVGVVQWPSDDGLPVEGLLIKPPGYGEGAAAAAAPYPLITFTHCGPAMAVLQTFIGYGSVCARFPLEIWAERGYLVLMPNYRGSTGCKFAVVLPLRVILYGSVLTDCL